MSKWKEIEDEQRESLKSELQRIQQLKESKAVTIAGSGSGSGWIVYSIGGFDFTDLFKLICTIIIFLILAFVIGCLLFTCVKFCFDVYENAVHRRILDFENDCIQNEMEEDIFENSIKKLQVSQ